MYPLQQSKDEIPNYRPDKSDQDQDQDPITQKTNIINHLPVNIRQPPERKISLKRIMHRDIERQRRQEMAQLYASLRTLLPLEYIKGKRSISDHMHEAVNYIKYLERNVGELRIRRDKLIITKNGNGVETVSSNSNLTVTVNPCRPDGLEILIGSNTNDGTIFPISRVLKNIPRNQGINVVSCISNYTNDRSVHSILAQVSDPECIHNMAILLQQKLTNVLICD